MLRLLKAEMWTLRHDKILYIVVRNKEEKEWLIEEKGQRVGRLFIS